MEENNIVILEDIFDQKMIDLLYLSCKKQFVYNIAHHDQIYVTNCILDCHGLALSSSVVFPYYENHWNIFCMKIKKIIIDYCDKVGLDKTQITPHSCWGERSVNKVKNNGKTYKRFHSEQFQKNIDEWLEQYLKVEKIELIRVIYFLKNPDPKFGTTVSINNKIISIPGKENSLCIIPCGDNMFSNKFPIDTDEKYNLVFDWYLHPPNAKNMATWFLPDLDYKNNYKEQLEHWWYKKGVKYD
jgi:hypothetical protein